MVAKNKIQGVKDQSNKIHKLPSDWHSIPGSAALKAAIAKNVKSGSKMTATATAMISKVVATEIAQNDKEMQSKKQQ